MLAISPESMASLGQLSEGQFRHNLAGLLREHFPDHATDRDAVYAVIDVAVADARAAGLRGAQALATYTVLAFAMGLEVKDDPRFIDAVRLSGANEADKIEWMGNWLTAVSQALDS